MKKKLLFLQIAYCFLFFSCVEQNRPVWERDEVEFNDAVLRNPVPGEAFPRITVSNTIGTVTLRVNLVANQRPTDETINYRVLPEKTTAAENTDFRHAGSFVIPANSSFGFVNIEVINTGAIGGFVDLTLELVGNASISPSPNFKQVQLRITRPNAP